MGVEYIALNNPVTTRCSAVLRVDGYNQASPSGNQGQMMGMSGRGGAIGPEGTANMGTPLMSENGAMVMYPEALTKLRWLIFEIKAFFVEYIGKTLLKNCVFYKQ